MPTPETVYIAETLAATAFYYGFAGGTLAVVVFALIPKIYRKLRSLTEWR